MSSHKSDLDHEGSWILNQVLFLLKNKYHFFDNMNQKQRQMFLEDIFDIGYCYNCRNEEIMYDLGADLGYCFVCKKSAKKFDKNHNICRSCSEKYLKLEDN
jgi:hypothetical protein